MVIINRVNLHKLNETVEKMRRDLSKTKKITRVEGEWLLDDV